MPQTRPTYHLRPGAAGAADSRALSDRLAVLVEDRASTAEALVREASEVLLDWLETQGEDWGPAAARQLIDEELEPLRAAHAWRGPVAGWLRALGRTVGAALGQLDPDDSSPSASLELDSSEPGRTARGLPPRELLAEELGLWLGGLAGPDLRDIPWNGEPLAAGRRLPDRDAPGAGLIGELERGEAILVHGFSETVARAVEAAVGAGLAPEVVLTEGGPDLGGRRMARRLLPRGAKLRVVYDAAALDAVARADRIWLGTEAIGAHAFVARVGTRALLEEARRLEVPTAVLATSDKLVPGGGVEPPAWCERDHWLLWENAPEGVRVDSQAYELVSLDLPDTFATEHGRQSAAQLSLSALRTDAGR